MAAVGVVMCLAAAREEQCLAVCMGLGSRCRQLIRARAEREVLCLAAAGVVLCLAAAAACAEQC